MAEVAPDILESLAALNPVLDLSNSVSYDAATGALTIHFFLTDEDGNGIDVTEDAYELRVYVSELVPGNPATDGDAWNQLFNERGTPAADAPLPGTLTLVDAATGEYTYLCDNALAASDNVTRVTVRARWRETIDGTRYVFANPVNASYDFLQSDPATELASSGADMVTTAACETCHGARIGDVGHGGGYTQVKTCNHCHNVNYLAAQGDTLEADFAHMVHRIHDAGVFTELTDHGGNVVDFSELTYPQHINTCSKCHDGPDADLAYLVPTRANCGSCHENVNFATGEGHAGGSFTDDGACALCHQRSGGVGGGIETVHNIAPEPANVPEFDVTIGITAPVNGEYYEVGEAPVITVTLADGSGPVAGTVYTADADGEAAENVGEGLSTANLFVYGPRSEAVPVLTTDSTTDPAFDPVADTPRQGHSLLLTGGASDDPLVRTDANGYAYQLMAIPAGLEAGTYMIRFEGADYGAVAADDYVTSSSAVMTFQIGTADESLKVAGDACVDCHGATIMHLEGAHPHHAPFDTDGCLACHDYSGNYGDALSNRVHAVHGETVTGDLHGRDWSHVTFPQPANNCRVCHTSGVEVWRNPVPVACAGCHGGDPDAFDVAPGEAAAAEHMRQNSADADPFDATAGNNPNTCLVCHGEGRIADLFDTHQLIMFPVPVPDPNE